MASRSWKAPASKVRMQCSGCAPFFSLLMNGPSRWAPAQTETESPPRAKKPAASTLPGPSSCLSPTAKHSSCNYKISRTKDAALEAAKPHSPTAITELKPKGQVAEGTATAGDRLRERAGLCPPVYPPNQESSSPICAFLQRLLSSYQGKRHSPRVAPGRTASGKTTYPGYLLHGLHRFLH